MASGTVISANKCKETRDKRRDGGGALVPCVGRRSCPVLLLLATLATADLRVCQLSYLTGIHVCPTLLVPTTGMMYVWVMMSYCRSDVHM